MRKNTFLLAIITALFVSCADDQSKKENDAAPPEPVKESEQGATAEELSNREAMEANKFDFVLPSPLQIAAIFQRAGLEYIPALTHEVEAAKNYNTEFKLAMNFGVYSSDLSYSVLNGQSQNSIEYLNTVRDLSEQLGISAIFATEPLLEKFESNINNRDSIVYILSKIQRNLDLYLDENNSQHKSVIYFAGAWIEGMYIGAKSIDTRNRNEIAQRLVEQLDLLGNLIKGLTNIPNRTEEYNTLIAQLKELEKEMAPISNSGEEMDDGSIKYEVSDQELETIKNSVIELRNYITKY